MTEDYVTQRDLDMARKRLYDKLEDFDDDMTRAAFQQGGEFIYRELTRGAYLDQRDDTDHD